MGNGYQECILGIIQMNNRMNTGWCNWSQIVWNCPRLEGRAFTAKKKKKRAQATGREWTTLRRRLRSSAAHACQQRECKTNEKTTRRIAVRETGASWAQLVGTLKSPVYYSTLSFWWCLRGALNWAPHYFKRTNVSFFKCGV